MFGSHNGISGDAGSAVEWQDTVKNGVSYLGFHTYITASGQTIRKLKNQNKRNAQRKFLRMAKLVAAGKLPMEKFQTSYGAWKNHISHGNCYRLGVAMDKRVKEILHERIAV